LKSASLEGGRVSAYLVMPPGKGPFAELVFLQSGQWDRHEFLAEAELLAEVGAARLRFQSGASRPWS